MDFKKIKSLLYFIYRSYLIIFAAVSSLLIAGFGLLLLADFCVFLFGSIIGIVVLFLVFPFYLLCLYIIARYIEMKYDQYKEKEYRKKHPKSWYTL